MRFSVVAFIWLTSFGVLANNVNNDMPNGAPLSKVTRFSQQMGLAAVNIPDMLSNPAQSLSVLEDMSSSNISAVTTGLNRDGTWFNHNDKADIWIGRLTKDNTYFLPALNFDADQQTMGLNAAINVGRFTAETALISRGNSVLESDMFYVQGSYTFVENDYFNLAITAKLETMSQLSVVQYLGNENFSIKPDSVIRHPAKNATLGLVGTVELSPQWTLMGAITSTTVDKELQQSPLINGNYVNMALIGTSYSF